MGFKPGKKFLNAFKKRETGEISPAAFSPEIGNLLKRIYTNENSYYDFNRGCRIYNVPSTITPEELGLLSEAGYSPNQFQRIAHDEAISRLRAAAQVIDLRHAADAFVASLTSQTLAWRTVLPAVALGLAMPAHDHDRRMSNGAVCSICFHRDEERDAASAAHSRFNQGAGWDDTLGGPVGAMFALEAVTKIQEWPEPTPRDIWVFHQLLALLRGLPAATRYSKARDAIRSAKFLPANNPYVIGTMLEALATIGILANEERPGLFTRFTTAGERDQRPNERCEAPGPLAWWSAADGLNEPLIARLFGHLICPDQEPEAPKAVRSSTKRK